MNIEPERDYPLHPEMYALMLSDARSTLKSLGVLIVIFPGVTILVLLLALAIEYVWVAFLVVGGTLLIFGFVSLLFSPTLREAKRGEEVARLNWEEDPVGSRQAFMAYMSEGHVQRSNFVDSALKKRAKRESLICLGVAALLSTVLYVLVFPEEGGVEMIFGLTIVLFWFIYGPWYLLRGQSLKVSSQVVRAEREKKFILKGLDKLSDMDGLKGELSVFVHEERGALSPMEQ